MTAKDSARHMLLAVLNVSGVPGLIARLTRVPATIFYAHRFVEPETGLEGYSPDTLRMIVRELRKHRFNLLALEELFRRLREGEPLERAVAFTMDDGYFDQGRVAGRILAEYDCPATIFGVSGFMDGRLWLWWDQLDYIFEHTPRKELKVRVGEREVAYAHENSRERLANSANLTYRCERIPEAERLRCIAQLSLDADVEVPFAPPPRCAPVTWDEARQLERRGITFGPHTVTHPVLSCTTDEQAEYEIAESWARLKQELAHPVPVFCYPHGQPVHYGDREAAIVARVGMWGGVSGHFDDFRPAEYRRPPAICSVPRSSMPEDLLGVLQWVSGLEKTKMRIRRNVTHA